MKSGESDPMEREHIIHQYAYLVKYAAGRLSMRIPSTVRVEELISAGSVGLIEAVDKFDPQRDVDFKTYALYRIKGAMLDELRSRDWCSRSARKRIQEFEKAVMAVEAREGGTAEDWQIAQELGMGLEDYFKILSEINSASLLSLDDYLTDDSKDTAGKTSFRDCVQSRDPDNPDTHLGREELKQILAEAIGRLSEKEQLVISLYYYEELTLKEIGHVLELTESRICQIHAMVLIKLKARLKSYCKPL